jgi:hypothetical protein
MALESPRRRYDLAITSNNLAVKGKIQKAPANPQKTAIFSEGKMIPV